MLTGDANIFRREKVSKDWKNWLLRKYVNANVVKQDCLRGVGGIRKKGL